jgi:hypothetical protein
MQRQETERRQTRIKDPSTYRQIQAITGISTIYCGGIRLGLTIIANWRSMSGYGTLALSKVCSTKVPTGPYLPHISSHSSGD